MTTEKSDSPYSVVILKDQPGNHDHRDLKKRNLCGKGSFIMTTEITKNAFSVVNTQGSLPGNVGSFPATVPYT